MGMEHFDLPLWARHLLLDMLLDELLDPLASSCLSDEDWARIETELVQVVIELLYVGERP